MITQGQIAAVLGHPVYDVDGNKIGDTKHVFLDDATGEPEWVSIKTGLFGTSESFVPTREATMVDDHLEVSYAKATVKDAPHVDVDAGGFLTVDEEHRLYEHYGIAWDEGRGWQQVANPSDQEGRARTDSRAVPDVTERASLPYGNTTAPGITRDGKEIPDTESARPDGSEDGTGAMTRSQEGRRAGMESPAAGQVRLRLYVAPQEWR
ncbi:PRC-barrel domain-containing protein [Streptomyces sp. NPDC002698]|uniref:PRC-barrel domain-containing protein n=1 Tax=Streptomyces sp. NPDC002698 TaxID=3364660 RepID=UPI00368CFCD9